MIVLAEPERPAEGSKRSLHTSLLQGMSALGVSLILERVSVFGSSVLAARIGGAETFGAYSLALTTANNVASYAGAGIGTTSTRFVAEHPPGTAGYLTLLRALAMVAAISSGVAMAVLWLGAGPLATMLLRNDKLGGPLRVAAISAAAFILLECCRGLLIGQRSYSLLLLLSAIVGSGTLLTVPVAAQYGAATMLAGQAGAVLVAVTVACWVIWRRGRAGKVIEDTGGRPSIWRVWRFGSVQLAGALGLHASGWWIATLVARDDPSLVHMAFYAVANQLRNMTALVPGLVWQSGFSMLTKRGGSDFGGSDRVLVVTTYAASMLAAAFAGLAIAVMPWILNLLYGGAYTGSELAGALAVVTALIHMGSAPASARLMSVSLRHTGMVNSAWAVFVALAGTWLIPGNGVSAAVAVVLAAHVLSTALVLYCLHRHNELPKGIVATAGINLAAGVLLLVLAYGRINAWLSLFVAAIACAVVAAAAVAQLWRMGRNHGVAPASFEWSSTKVLEWVRHVAYPRYR